MLASVIINNFNYGRIIGDAIASALAQTHPDVEVIVVDDGSTDGSHEVIHGFGGRITPIFKENGGMASTHNVGFAASRGAAVVFLDADDILLPQALERAFAVLEDGVVHVHWPTLHTDAAGRSLGRVEPEEPLPEGDLRRAAVERGPYASRAVPMSANVWTRDFLEQVLPMPEPVFRSHTDAYLSALAPVYGETRALR